MPKTIYIPKDAKHSGISVTYTPSAERLDIFGWYDTMVGLCEPYSFTLRQFFDELGITEKDCLKAFKEKK